MFVLESYELAVAFCVVTMLCWGSWANTQKLAGKTWRFELFYWDYVIGVVLMSLIIAFTMGSNGTAGRGFLADLRQADAANLASAALGGVVFNLANILLVAAIAISGMSVAFPVGIGLALVLGVLINYVGGERSGNATLLFLGVGLIMLAIILDALAYRKVPGQQSSGGTKGLVLSVLCGILMSTFYFLVARSKAQVELAGTKELVSVTAQHLHDGVLQAGKMTAYTANVVFALGILVSNFVFNTIIMIKPFTGKPVPLSDYFKGRLNDHLWGVVGGCIWGVGMGLNIAAADVASPAVSYGLGQGATLVAGIWGVFIWREFRQAPPETNKLLALMFGGYVVGLGLVIAARLAPVQDFLHQHLPWLR
jgi:glucose uptake protein